MNKIEIFDPAMCCSTGVCGPGVDPELLRMATMVGHLEKAQKDITRYNLSEVPQVFADNKAVSEMLMNEGADALPITLLNGKIVKKKAYPANEELLAWSDISQEELVKIIAGETSEQNGSTGCCGGSTSKGCC